MSTGEGAPDPRREHSLFGYTPEELVAQLELKKRFRGQQLFLWMHRDGATGFDEMSNLPAALREELTGRFGSPYSTRVSHRNPDEDGTVKIAVESSDGAAVESVLLQDREGRKTACLSSQVGCAMGCRFCRTAQMGFIRNLSAGEIVEQLYHLRNAYGKIDNIVFMGMGEPLANLEQLRRAVALLQHTDGLGMSLRRITVSTSGLTGAIYDMAEHGPPVRLALSLITTDQSLREELMPIAKTNPLPELEKALEAYRDNHKRRVTLEYVVIGGVNASPEDAEGLAALAKPLRAQVNIIPWNPVPELDFSEPSRDEVRSFIRMLEERGVTISQRYTRGRGVNGACGQLAVGLHDKESI
jgi:23S rRNA (adenine2503-C2)-methyltransferase